MTVSTATNTVQFTGTGSVVALPFSFPIFASSDLVVTYKASASADPITWVETADYTVSVSSYPGAGSITPTAAPASGSTITIQRVLALTQETDLVNQGAYYAQVVEDALDRVTMITQQLSEQQGRQLVVPVSDGAIGELPPASERAGKFMGFDGDGDPIAATTITTSPVTAQGAALIDDETAAEQRATLGLPNAILEAAYPIGSLYFNASDGTNPATLLGFGTWSAIGSGQVLIGVGTHTDVRSEQKTFAAGATGGEYQHVMTTDEMPTHSHAFPNNLWSATGGIMQVASTPGGNDFNTNSGTSHAGSSQPHNNLPPYLAVYIWQRTA